jgi:PadR family transcriptional regulator PadR
MFRHGYQLSPGTLYPMFQGLERSGYLRSRKERLRRTCRRADRATALGRAANRLAKIRGAS